MSLLRTSAFTLLELAIVVGIIVIVGLITFPNVVGRMPHYRLDGAESAVFAELRRARMRAVSESQPVQVAVSPGDGLVTIRSDSNGNGTYEDTETTTVDINRFTGVSIGASPTNGSFSARGAFNCASGAWKLNLSSEKAGDCYVYVFPGGQVERTDEELN